MSDALSEWDRTRVRAAVKAFWEAVGLTGVDIDPSLLGIALLAVIRSADRVPPPEAHRVLPLPPAPERYDSLGKPLATEQPTGSTGSDGGLPPGT